MKKLNIGCGNIPLVGYTNIDKYYYPGSDNKLLDKELAETWNKEHPDSPWFYGDMIKIDFPNDTFDEVIMVHAIEHLSMEHGNLAIKEAHRVCKKGGFVEIETPDLITACKLMINADNEVDSRYWYRVMGLIYGTVGSDGEGQFHLCCYSRNYLKFKLVEREFIKIEEIPVGFGHGNRETGVAESDYDFRMRAFK